MPSRAIRVAHRSWRHGRRAVRRLATDVSGVRLRVDSGSVALTFDDGPDPVHTPRVLDELARMDVQATFFVVGNRATEHPGLVRRMLDEGHSVGSHSASHPDPWTLNVRELAADYRAGRARAEGAAGRPVTLFRPPKGYLDLRGAVAIRAGGLRPWLWTVDPEDWRPGITASDVVSGLAALAAGDVVLLHDGIEAPLDDSTRDRSPTVEAIAPVVRALRDRGLRTTVIPEPPGQGR